MSHRTGSYWEIGSLGTYTTKSVLDMYLIAGGDSYYRTVGNVTEHIDGQSYRYSKGDYVLKSDGTIYLDANRVQLNTGMLAVSGEINSPNINADIFTSPFADTLAKVAMVAWDLGTGKGGSPPAMINGSLGFMGNEGSQSLLTNSLSTKSPTGASIITNGIPPSNYVDPTATTSTLATVTATPLANGVGVSIQAGNAILSAAAAVDADSVSNGNNTPVFLKHVSFDKPTLFSQSTVASLPDPSLYVNNVHVIVSPTTGAGELFISDGNTWNPVGSGAANTATITAIATGVANNVIIPTVNQVTAMGLALTSEEQARAAGDVATAVAANEALQAGLLAEAAARGTAITAVSNILQTQITANANYILTLTADVNANTSAIQNNYTAAANAASANASAIETVAANVAANTASINSNATVAANATSALATTVNANYATTQTALGVNASAIATETTNRTTAVSALASLITNLTASVASNTASIDSNQTASANALSAAVSTLNAQIASTAVTTTNNANAFATAGIATETTNRTNAISAVSTQINTINSTYPNSTPTSINGLISSAITTYNSTTAAANIAAATSVTALSATLGGTYATIGTVSSVSATLNGIASAQYGVTVTANGAVSGFQLLNGGNNSSVFKIQANSLQLVNSSGGTGNAPFTVDSSGNLTITGGAHVGGSIMGGAYTGYVWPSSGTGFYLGSGGLLLGNPNTGQYFQVDTSGNLYAPGFHISGGNATFSGALSAATGTFNGTLAANSITTGMIVSNSATNFAGFTLAINDNSPLNVAFSMDANGVCVIIATIVFNWSGSAAGSASFSIGIDSSAPNTASATYTSSASAPVGVLSLQFSATLASGYHLINWLGQHTGATGQHEIFYTILRSYR